MNYYKIDNLRLKADGVDTFAHWTDGSHSVVSDVDVRRVIGFDLSPEDVQKRYGTEPLTQDELINIRRSGKWSIKKTRN